MSTVSGKFLYFGYGSNLLKHRLQLMNPSAVYKTIAKLNNYKLSFSAITNPSLSAWQGGGATIVQDAGSYVWGVVWELGNEDMESLDKQESVYEPITVEVVSQENKTYICRSYQSKIYDTWDNRPSPHYKDVILRGAVQSQLPDDYIKVLHQIEDNGYSGQVKLYDKVIKQLNDITQ